MNGFRFPSIQMKELVKKLTPVQYTRPGGSRLIYTPNANDMFNKRAKAAKLTNQLQSMNQ